MMPSMGSLYVTAEGTLIGGDQFEGPNISLDSGRHWIADTSGCSTFDANSITRTPEGRVLLSSKTSGLYMDDGSLTTPDGKSIVSAPTSFDIYPNPTLGPTHIRLNLAATSHSRITLSNSIGAEVKTLYEGDLEKGAKTFDADFSQLATGVYFIHVDAGVTSSVVGFVKF